MTDAAIVQVVARVATQPRDGGSRPTSPLQSSACIEPRDLSVRPIDSKTAISICKKWHYLRSYPGGGLLNFGVFADHSLVGVAVFGVGPYNAHRYFTDAQRGPVIPLARFRLDDRSGRLFPRLDSRLMIRLLRRWQNTAKAVLAYSDPTAGHDGAIYRAAGFAYLGTSEATPLYRLPDASIHHGRSIGHGFGTRRLKYVMTTGVAVCTVTRAPHHLSRKVLYH